MTFHPSARVIFHPVCRLKKPNLLHPNECFPTCAGGKSFSWFGRQERESRRRSVPCLGQYERGGAGHAWGRRFPMALAGGSAGSGSRARSLLLCAMRFAYFLTQPPTVLNPQNYSYFHVKWKPKGLAVPTAGARAPPFSSVGLMAAEMLP